MKHDGKGDGNKDWWSYKPYKKQMSNDYFMPNSIVTNDECIYLITISYIQGIDWAE